MRLLKIPVDPELGQYIRYRRPEKLQIPDPVVDHYQLKKSCPDFRRVVLVEPERTTIFDFEGVDREPNGFFVRLGDLALKTQRNV